MYSIKDDEEIDYMSDVFLQESSQQDIRPGLIHSRAGKRIFELSKKKTKLDQLSREKNKPIKEIAKQNFTEGLQKPISSDNKGFALLTKMGFKPGTGLGKAGEGCSEPISVEVKNNREGLGVKAALQELKALHLQKWRDRQIKVPSETDFRARMIEVAKEKQNTSDLCKSQHVCKTLDTNEMNSICEPLETWFWPDNAEDNESSSEDQEEEMSLSVQCKLDMLTVYLREKYYYCIWCGTGFQDSVELEKECPGPSREYH